jgi:hypothetical protein
MAEEGTLFLTDCYNQPVSEREREQIEILIGDVLHGHRLNPAGNQVRQAMPAELRRYTVKVRSIPHKVQVDEPVDNPVPGASPVKSVMKTATDVPIRFCVGSVVIGESSSYDEAKAIGDAFAQGLEWYEKEYLEFDEPEAELTLDEAVWCLRQQGKYVKRASSLRLQEKFWKVAEVRPEPVVVEEEPPAKRRGRPRKSETQATL